LNQRGRKWSFEDRIDSDNRPYGDGNDREKHELWDTNPQSPYLGWVTEKNTEFFEFRNERVALRKAKRNGVRHVWEKSPPRGEGKSGSPEPYWGFFSPQRSGRTERGGGGGRGWDEWLARTVDRNHETLPQKKVWYRCCARKAPKGYTWELGEKRKRVETIPNGGWPGTENNSLTEKGEL